MPDIAAEVHKAPKWLWIAAGGGAIFIVAQMHGAKSSASPGGLVGSGVGATSGTPIVNGYTTEDVAAKVAAASATATATQQATDKTYLDQLVGGYNKQLADAAAASKAALDKTNATNAATNQSLLGQIQAAIQAGKDALAAQQAADQSALAKAQAAFAAAQAEMAAQLAAARAAASSPAPAPVASPVATAPVSIIGQVVDMLTGGMTQNIWHAVNPAGWAPTLRGGTSGTALMPGWETGYGFKLPTTYKQDIDTTRFQLNGQTNETGWSRAWRRTNDIMRTYPGANPLNAFFYSLRWLRMELDSMGAGSNTAGFDLTWIRPLTAGQTFDPNTNYWVTSGTFFNWLPF